MAKIKAKGKRGLCSPPDAPQTAPETVDESDLLPVVAQIDLQRRMIEAAHKHADHQKYLAECRANLYAAQAGTGYGTTTSASSAYRDLAQAERAAASMEYAKSKIEIEAAQLQVDAMQAALDAERKRRGIT